MVGTAKAKKWDNINGRVKSGYYVHAQPTMSQYSTTKPIDRNVLTVGAVSGPHC